MVFVQVDEEIRRLYDEPNWEQEKAQLENALEDMTWKVKGCFIS